MGNTYWLGTPVLKATSDLWIFQEIIYQTKPDVIVEAGTYKGGSAYYMASICELLNHGRAITIDIYDMAGKPKHKRVTFLKGFSTSPGIVAEVQKQIQPNYLIIEDTNVDHFGIWTGQTKGPGEAVREFLQTTNEFVPDKAREQFLLTFNPGGISTESSVDPQKNSL